MCVRIEWPPDDILESEMLEDEDELGSGSYKIIVWDFLPYAWDYFIREGLR